jgi:hypothetical protein
VYKEGFVPFETRVEVAGGQNAVIESKLDQITQGGRLKVVERDGKPASVLVDNVAVGSAPWEGQFPIGEHTVALKAEGNLGTPPSPARVKLNEVTSMVLSLEVLEGELRVEPTPIGATVAIDGVVVGRGSWEGRLRTGARQVEIAAEGFLPAKRNPQLVAGRRELVSVVLERDPTSPLWRTPELAVRHVLLDLHAGAALTPSMGGDVIGQCTGGCSVPMGLGGFGMLYGGYELGSRFAGYLGLGYLMISEKVPKREAELTPVGKTANPGTARDELKMGGVVIGAALAYRMGTRWRTTVRLGAGVVLGTVTDKRTGTFLTNSSSGSVAYPASASESQAARYGYAAPEVRFARRFGDHFELGLGVQAMMLFALTQPVWKDEKPVLTGSCGANSVPGCTTDGLGTFGSQGLTGKFLLLVVPGVSASYEF